MLHHAKVIKALQELAPNLTQCTFEEIDKAHVAWQLLCDNAIIQETIKSQCQKHVTPHWGQNISNTYHMLPANFPYEVVAIDGSQIYPDRHLGIFCALINIGIISLSYNQNNFVKINSHPYVFINDDEIEFYNTIDATNAKRQEMELHAALQFEENNQIGGTRLYMFDGSLIFWHLVSKEYKFVNHFFARSIDLLDQFYKQKMLTAWYISVPKSKELIGILNHAHELFSDRFPHEFIRVRDESLMRCFLESWQRTVVFTSNASIAQQYPKQLQPHFVYCHVADEIARIEIPAWIAQDETLLSQTIAMVVDQVQKGYGYPVSLAEAHEQAVVKGPDRDFFFHLMSKWYLNSNKKISITQKNSKKRRMTI